MKAIIPFKSKFLKPCKKLVPIFKFKLRRTIFIRPLRVRLTKSPTSSIFRFLRPRRKMDKLAELRSLSEAAGCDRDRLLFSSPLTPASYVNTGGGSRRKGPSDVADACRSFEKYLVEMLVEEGKMSDLMGVEELLYCWKKLTSPVFVDLVSRFYAELCTDLFSGNDDDIADSP